MDQDAIVDMFNSNITATSTVLTPTTWERYPVKHLKDYINEKYNEECAVNLMGHTMFEHGKYDAKVFFSKVDDAINTDINIYTLIILTQMQLYMDVETIQKKRVIL